MPISRIKRNAINNDAITSAKLEDGSVVAVDLASNSVTTAKMNGLTSSSSGFIKADGDGTMSVATADLVDDTTPQLGGNLDGNGNTIDLSANTGAMGLPTGTTAQRPGSPSTGYFRFNTSIGSVEFYDGSSWIATNLIPTVDSVSGSIYSGLGTTLTLSLTNATDTIFVNFLESGSIIETVSGVSVTSGSADVTVPSSVYGQTVGDTITISITNQDGTPSSNSQTKTVAASPTGGNTVSTSGNYRYHTFTSAGNFVVPSGFSATVEYLLVAGGAGGGWDYGGGGGAGGAIDSTASVSANTYAITIGSGGAAGTSGTKKGGTGGNSTAFGQTALGGGGGMGGAGTPVAAESGGSGGGGGWAQPTGGSGTSGQGNAGGDGNNRTTSPVSTGGGGGKGAVGGTGNSSVSGNGGVGINWKSLGTYYAGGGGGGGYVGYGVAIGTGGNGGGGDGGLQALLAESGTANTGGGGGGDGGGPGPGPGAGGSGICIIRYDVTAL